MELSETLFMEITGVRLSTPIYETVAEKRKHTRLAFGERARIFPLLESASGYGVPVLVRDLSLSGVGFQAFDEMSIGDEFVLQLTSQSGEIIHLHCITQRCEVGGTGLEQFVIGATFELVLTETMWRAPETTRQSAGTRHPQLAARAAAESAANLQDAVDTQPQPTPIVKEPAAVAMIESQPEQVNKMPAAIEQPAVAEPALAADEAKPGLVIESPMVTVVERAVEASEAKEESAAGATPAAVVESPAMDEAPSESTVAADAPAAQRSNGEPIAAVTLPVAIDASPQPVLEMTPAVPVVVNPSSPSIVPAVSSEAAHVAATPGYASSVVVVVVPSDIFAGGEKSIVVNGVKVTLSANVRAAEAGPPSRRWCQRTRRSTCALRRFVPSRVRE